MSFSLTHVWKSFEQGDEGGAEHEPHLFSQMSAGHQSEAALIARILAGEKELFHELVRPYERMIYLTVFAILKNEVESEDAAQEAIINAYRHLNSFRMESKFSTWLVTIAVNQARQKLRRDKRATFESSTTKIPMSCPRSTSAPRGTAVTTRSPAGNAAMSSP